MRNESSSSTSSSRRSAGRRSCSSSNSSNSNGTAIATTNKPKQPQRGLGVAQLEKIRLHALMEEEMRMQGYHGEILQQPLVPTIGIPLNNNPVGTSQTQTAGSYHSVNMELGMEVLYGSNIGYSELHHIPNQLGMNNITRHLLSNIEDVELSRNTSFGTSTPNYNTAHDSSRQDVDLELKL